MLNRALYPELHPRSFWTFYILKKDVGKLPIWSEIVSLRLQVPECWDYRFVVSLLLLCLHFCHLFLFLSIVFQVSLISYIHMFLQHTEHFSGRVFWSLCQSFTGLYIFGLHYWSFISLLWKCCDSPIHHDSCVLGLLSSHLRRQLLPLGFPGDLWEGHTFPT